jgi:hypothetical protein
MVVVGALNVGSIKLSFYDKIKTNLLEKNSFRIQEHIINPKTFMPGD